MDGFELDQEKLASEVTQAFHASAAIESAGSAGLSAQTMSENAFGMLCVGMVPPSQAVQSIAVAALKAEAGAYEALALNLREALAAYEMADSTAAARFRTLQRRLG